MIQCTAVHYGLAKRVFTETYTSKMAKLPGGDNLTIGLIVVSSWINFYNEF